MRKFAERTGLTVMNTLSRKAAAPTYFNTQGYKGRIDYILTDYGRLRNPQPIATLPRLGFRLQLPSTEELADHIPIASAADFTVEFSEKLSRPLPPSLVDAITKNPQATSWAEDLDNWASSSLAQDAMNRAVDAEDPDAAWEVLNGAIQNKLTSWSSFSGVRKFPGESFEVARLLEKREELRNQLRNASFSSSLGNSGRSQCKQNLAGSRDVLRYSDDRTGNTDKAHFHSIWFNRRYVAISGKYGMTRGL